MANLAKRKIGLDVGDVRIGVAIRDYLSVIANPRETYTRSKGEYGLEKDIDYFVSYAKTEDAGGFVLGLPINMDGTEGVRCEITRNFGDKLHEKSGLPVEYVDERLTTVSAERLLIEADVRREKRKTVIDKVAATIILQSYLDRAKK